MKKIYYLFFNFIFFDNFYAMKEVSLNAIKEINRIFSDKNEHLKEYFCIELLISIISDKKYIKITKNLIQIFPDKNQDNEEKRKLAVSLVTAVNNYNDEWKKEERKKILQPDSGEQKNNSKSSKKENKNKVNIKNLTKNQIVRFDEEKIKKLNIEQLEKFTSLQCSYFNQKQFHWFSLNCKKIIIAKIQELNNREIKNMDIIDRNYWIKYFTRKQLEDIDEITFKNISLLRVNLESIYCFFSEKQKKELTENHIKEIINYIKLNSKYYDNNKFWVDLVITEMFTEKQVKWIPKEDIKMVLSFIFKMKNGEIKNIDQSKKEFIQKLSEEQSQALIEFIQKLSKEPSQALNCKMSCSIVENHSKSKSDKESRVEISKNINEDSINFQGLSSSQSQLLNNNHLGSNVKQSSGCFNNSSRLFFTLFSFSSVLLLAPMGESLLRDIQLSPEFEVFIFKLENLIKTIKLDKFISKWAQLIQDNKKKSIGVWSVITSICIGKWIQKKMKNNKLSEKDTKLNNTYIFNSKINNIEK